MTREPKKVRLVMELEPEVRDILRTVVLAQKLQGDRGTYNSVIKLAVTKLAKEMNVDLKKYISVLH